MISSLAKRLRKYLYSGLSVIVVFFSLSGSLGSALAADDPATNAARPTPDALEIPGSFKDLPEARDAVTAKRAAEDVASVTQSAPASATLLIDAEKLARPGALPNLDRYANLDKSILDDELIDFHATAYCLKGRTASGINTRPGVIAADPSVLPLGTVVHLRAGRYTGTYTVMDTGALIKGRRVDVYVPSYREAVEFGRQKVKLKVISRNSTKSAKNLLAEEF
jgi:3D (Asp-Asp-Asp) domain-containing protein